MGSGGCYREPVQNPTELVFSGPEGEITHSDMSSFLQHVYLQHMYKFRKQQHDSMASSNEGGGYTFSIQCIYTQLSLCSNPITARSCNIVLRLHHPRHHLSRVTVTQQITHLYNMAAHHHFCSFLFRPVNFQYSDNGPLTDLLQTWTAQFQEWLCSTQSARYSWQEVGGQVLLQGRRVASGSCTVVLLVESCCPSVSGLFSPMSHAGPSLMPPVQGHSYINMNAPISNQKYETL